MGKSDTQAILVKDKMNILRAEEAEIKAAVKKAKKHNWIKVGTAFGFGSAVGGTLVGIVAWKIFKGLLGGLF